MLNKRATSREEVGPLPHLPRSPKWGGPALEPPCETALTRGAGQSSPAKDQTIVTSLEPSEGAIQTPVGPVGSSAPADRPPGEGVSTKAAGGSSSALLAGL